LALDLHATILGILSNPDPSSKCSKQVDSGTGWEVTLGLRIGEHWFHIMEWLHQFSPMIPIAFFLKVFAAMTPVLMSSLAAQKRSAYSVCC
jgi:hypothetical protein